MKTISGRFVSHNAPMYNTKLFGLFYIKAVKPLPLNQLWYITAVFCSWFMSLILCVTAIKYAYSVTNNISLEITTKKLYH